MKHDTPAAFEEGWSKVQRYLNAFIWNFERYAIPGSKVESSFSLFDSRLTNIYQEAQALGEECGELNTEIELTTIEIIMPDITGSKLERNAELAELLKPTFEKMDHVWVTHVDGKLTPAGHFCLSDTECSGQTIQLIASKCIELFYSTVSGAKPDGSPVLTALISDAAKHLSECIEHCAKHEGFKLHNAGTVRIILSPTQTVEPEVLNDVLHDVSAKLRNASITSKNLRI